MLLKAKFACEWLQTRWKVHAWTQMKEGIEMLDCDKVAGVNCKTVSKCETRRLSEGCTKQLETKFCNSMDC